MCLESLREAAQNGDANSQFTYGYRYFKGMDVEQNQEYGLSWIMKAASQNHACAQAWLSMCYRHGTGVDKDEQKSFYWLEKAAINEHAISQFSLGNVYYYGDESHEPNYEKAVEWYAKASQQDDEGAQVQLAICYALGKGVITNDSRAMRLFSKAAQKGNAKAQFWLGLYYFNAWAVQQDYQQAAYWFNQSAKQDYPDAQYELGKCYKLGNGVEKNDDISFEWFMKAAQNGLSKAQVEVGDYYLFSNPFSESNHYNPTEAVKWYRAAVENDNNPDAQNELGQCYEEGLGVSPSYEKASQWYLKSALQGSLYGKLNLVSLYKESCDVLADYSDELFEEAKVWCENQNLQPKEEPNTAFESHTAAILPLSAEKPIEKDNELKGFLNQLSELVGLDEVKNEVNSIINLLKLQQIRKEYNLPKVPMSLHLVFSGNPGTGKTTVARLLAKIYHKLGVLSQGQLIEVDRSGLVGGYVGQTAIKTQAVIQSALGGILFIDEAYTLVRGNTSNDFGQEAIDTILKSMEDYRDDLVIIVAGYPDLMEKFINSNPGLKSRFNKYIQFDDYTPHELLCIFKTLCSHAHLTASDEVNDSALAYFQKIYETRDEKFANARGVRNYFEKAVANQANRVATYTNISENDISTLILQDVENITLN